MAKYKVKCYETAVYTFEVEAADEDAAWSEAHDILLGEDGALRLVQPEGTRIECEVPEREWDITEKCKFERDFFEVCEEDGVKYVRILGWMEERDEYIGILTADSRSVFKAGEPPEDVTFPEYTNYLEEIDWDEDKAIEVCETYFDGEPGTHLPMRDVTQETPCGNYWCMFYEEPGRE